MTRIENPYAGITFFPAVEKYSASISCRGTVHVIGYFSTLQEALAARKGAKSWEVGQRGYETR